MNRDRKPREKDLYVRVGARISSLMKERGLSNRQMYYLTGIDRGDMSRYRNGIREATLLTYAKIAEGLEVDITDLFVDDGQKPNSL
ncbi:helix-turn-helix domain-containing protein [Chitinophaga sp. NPDC101104]|uniref:helix-turn-helix domain-containing protein n=1 Tax=Chitinophaga sp. NPDC101104 TaxID=3390561 RepID=UPI003D00911D